MLKHVHLEQHKVIAVFKDQGEVDNIYNPEVMLELLENHVSELEKSTLYPEAFDFIIRKEKYGLFFAMGSPQLFELGWTYNFQYKDSEITLTIEM